MSNSSEMEGMTMTDDQTAHNPSADARDVSTHDAERAERLAEWLCENVYRTPLDEDDWRRLDEGGRNVWRRLAEDALAALDPQEPTS